ncbi:hypothetical protein AWV80_26130 [Cupriavidus sp. UYMU48A]|nr:hypothetical protein AWV80_26130 [Cupriavidus sp. UYMU48A]
MMTDSGLAALTPVTVLTGFLGSGKTTLLNALLRDERLRDTAVIINEFGEVGLDHLLVSKADENVVLLDSGCLCCSIGNGLSETLETLFRQRSDSTIPAFKRVVVETTGLADPFPLLKIVLNDYFVSKHFSINGVLTTVDAEHGIGQLRDHREARHQASAASCVAITKTDIAAPDVVADLKGKVLALNEDAEVIPAYTTVGDQQKLSEELIELVTRAAGHSFVSPPAPSLVKLPVPGQPSEGSLQPLKFQFAHDEQIQSFVFRWDRPVNWQLYATWLGELQSLPAADLMRTKGLLQLDGSGPPYVIQGVQHTFSKPLRMADWPNADHRSWLVIIAKGIQRAALEKILQPVNV